MTANDNARMIGAIADAVAYVGCLQGQDALLYAEAGSGWVRGSLFIDHLAVIEWVDPAAHHLSELVLRLWTAAPDEKSGAP